MLFFSRQNVIFFLVRYEAYSAFVFFFTYFDKSEQSNLHYYMVKNIWDILFVYFGNKAVQ